jgi:hypothetical protein
VSRQTAVLLALALVAAAGALASVGAWLALWRGERAERQRLGALGARGRGEVDSGR